MTLLCLGALATSAFPQQDAARWLSRAIWVGWLCTWGFGVFGLTYFVASDVFLASFCTAAACGTSPETLRLTMILVRTLTRPEDIHVPDPSLTVTRAQVVLFTLTLVFYLAVVLSAYVHSEFWWPSEQVGQWTHTDLPHPSSAPAHLHVT
jgi:hypothetical protein